MKQCSNGKEKARSGLPQEAVWPDQEWVAVKDGVGTWPCMCQPRSGHLAVGLLH